MKQKFVKWLARVPSRRIVCVGLVAIMFAATVLCADISAYIAQREAQEKLLSIYEDSKEHMPIATAQVREAKELYGVSVTGLREEQKVVFTFMIMNIYEAYYKNLYQDPEGHFAPNDDPGPGLHVDDNGYKANIPSAWTPPVDTGVNVYVNLKTLDAFNPPQAWDARIAPPD